MSFEKAGQLLELAALAAGRRTGITIADVEERFGACRRTAQRMLRKLEERFPETDRWMDEDGRARWRLLDAGLRTFLRPTPEELAALDLAIQTSSAVGGNAQVLRSLKEKVQALVPADYGARLETDYDALLEAQGLVSRPGPRPIVDAEAAQVISEAIKACLHVEFTYRSNGEDRSRLRSVAPLGLRVGTRRYLVGMAEGSSAEIKTFRMDKIAGLKLTDVPFVRPQDFDLHAYSRRAFGAFVNDEEYGEVVWRFAPRAAEQASGYLFHPDQEFEYEADGSLVVRFIASGHLEMCWHLYSWGDKVEVVSPPELRAMVKGYARSDFAAMP